MSKKSLMARLANATTQQAFEAWLRERYGRTYGEPVHSKWRAELLDAFTAGMAFTFHGANADATPTERNAP